MTLAIVIVAYQSAGLIRGCLERAGAVAGAETIVVDNASTDGSAAAAQAAGARVIAMERNLGFAAGANAGARATAADLLCFLNPDCDLTAAVAGAAAAALAERPDSCAVPSFRIGGTTVSGRQPGYGRLKLAGDCMESGRWPGFLKRRLERTAGYHDTSWHWPLGTCLFIRRDRFLALGGFDESYFLYMEDVEFGRALSRAGGEVVALPFVLDHVGGGSSAIPGRRSRDLLRDARIAYGRRHYGVSFGHFLSLVARL